MPLTSSVWQNFALSQGTMEPASFKLAQNGGAAVLTGFIPTADLETILMGGIETAVADNASGKIFRTNPVSHPRFNQMFVREIVSAQDISFIEKVAADPDGYLEVPCLPAFADYRKYKIGVSFEPRPYALLDDSSIERYTIEYYDENGDFQQKSAYKEFWRGAFGGIASRRMTKRSRPASANLNCGATPAVQTDMATVHRTGAGLRPE